MFRFYVFGFPVQDGNVFNAHVVVSATNLDVEMVIHISQTMISKLCLYIIVGSSLSSPLGAIYTPSKNIAEQICPFSSSLNFTHL